MANTSDYVVGRIPISTDEGHFGSRVVYGIHKDTKREVAIKVIDKINFKKNPQFVNNVLLERSLLVQLKPSKYVVDLWASFHDEECIYLVMECMNLGNLQHVIQEGYKKVTNIEGTSSSNTNSQCFNCNWWLKEAVPYYGLQILSALECIHGKHRIAHADLKPENILINQNGQVKLADFGSAIILNNNDDHHDKKNTHRHNSSLLHMNTVDYASPEILFSASSDQQQSKLTASVDLWSFGCVIYAMISVFDNVHGKPKLASEIGHSPFHEKSDSLAFQSIMDYCNYYSTHDSNDDRTEQQIINKLINPFNSDENKSNNLVHDAPHNILMADENLAERDNENSNDSSLLKSCWWKLIKDLLHPNADQRLGAKDLTCNDSNGNGNNKDVETYVSIRANSVWQQDHPQEDIILDHNSEVTSTTTFFSETNINSNVSPFLPPPPSWWSLQQPQQQQNHQQQQQQQQKHHSPSGNAFKMMNMIDGKYGWTSFVM